MCHKVSSQLSALSLQQTRLEALRSLMSELRFLPAPDDEPIGTLVVARLVSTRRLAPRGHRMTSTGSLAFAAAVRVIDWIHGHAAVVRTASGPAHATGLANRDVLVIGVAYLPDRGHAILQNLARLAGRQLDERVVAFLGHQLRRTARRTHHLRALPGTQ